jgi:glycosyltransferase involved in cell wall biosynthesis
MAVAVLTNYLTPYRVPLYRLLAERYGTEVLCYGGGDRYVPSWFADLDQQLASAPFPARRLDGIAEALALGSRYEVLIAPFAGGAILPATYVGARRHRRRFVLWASVWAQPLSLTHAAALPLTRRIYRQADAVLAYGEHVRRYVAGIRGRDSDVFVAPQTVEPELFARQVDPTEVAEFRDRHKLGADPVVLYVGRLVPEKGVGVLLDAWPRVEDQATLVLIGEGPLAARARHTTGARLLAPLPRAELPAAYAAAELAVLPSIPTARFREPWGLVCNEAMHQGKPVVASDAVGAVEGGLVSDGVNGLVVPAGDADGLARAIGQLLADEPLRLRLGAAAREAVRPYTYEAMADAFGQALATSSGSGPARGSPRSSRWRTRRRT